MIDSACAATGASSVNVRYARFCRIRWEFPREAIDTVSGRGKKGREREISSAQIFARKDPSKGSKKARLTEYRLRPRLWGNEQSHWNYSAGYFYRCEHVARGGPSVISLKWSGRLTAVDLDFCTNVWSCTWCSRIFHWYKPTIINMDLRSLPSSLRYTDVTKIFGIKIAPKEGKLSVLNHKVLYKPTRFAFPKRSLIKLTDGYSYLKG